MNLAHVSRDKVTNIKYKWFGLCSEDVCSYAWGVRLNEKLKVKFGF